MNKADEPEWAWLETILDGIDKDEADDDKGWWETSTGAEFGARKLVELKQAIAARVAEIQRERDGHAHAAWLAQMRVAALEVAQHPPLGHLVVAKRDTGASAVGPVWPDRRRAEGHLARISGDSEKHPGIWHGAKFVLAEVREVKP